MTREEFDKRVKIETKRKEDGYYITMTGTITFSQVFEMVDPANCFGKDYYELEIKKALKEHLWRQVYQDHRREFAEAIDNLRRNCYLMDHKGFDAFDELMKKASAL